MNYTDFLHTKVQVAPVSGFEVRPEEINPALKPHQRDSVMWAVKGGRRALFESFGLGKTVQELDGCEYCKEDNEGYRKMIGAFSITNPFHGSVWNIETSHCKPRQIYFCPMCGRKLQEPPNEVTK